MSQRPTAANANAANKGAQQHVKKRRYPAADVQTATGSYGAASPAGGSSSSGGAMSLDAANTMPRALHVLEFAEARARELAALSHVLSASGGGAANTPGTNPAHISGGGRRVFQSLPRHMRRRAMSHNIKRLPQRLQGAAQREMDKIARSAPKGGEDGGGSGGSKAPSRRVRRRPHNVLAMHAHRMGVHQWLETHLWHAKRMKMANRWGYKLALNPTDRSLRACYNAAVHLATAFDASFLQVMAVFASDAQHIAALLAPLLPAADLAQLLSAAIVSGHCETTVHLHQPGTAPYGFITSAKAQWQPPAAPGAERQLWLWLHPAVFAIVQALLSAAAASTPASAAVRAVPLLGELCRFELRGHRCQAVLRMAIRQVEQATQAAATASAASTSSAAVTMSDAPSTASTASAFASLGALLSSYVSPALFPAHRIYALQAQHPEVMRPTPSQPFQLTDATREKQRGDIADLPRNATFGKAADAVVRMQLSPAHHTLLYGDAAATHYPSASPLFDAAFRQAHTRETRWGAKKQRYARIARKDTERKRRMHQRRGTDSAHAIAAANDSEDEGTVSDSAALRPPVRLAGSKHSKVSKDDLDMGSSSTPLPSTAAAPTSTTPAAPLPAPLSNQPYVLLIQQPGVSLQGSSAQPSLQVNSSTQSLGAGWDVVCAAGWGILLWRALIFAGARAIGGDDHARFQHELRRWDALTPADAPDSHAGQAHLLFRQRVARWWSDRIPGNKKPNYHRNHVPHPFGVPLFELLQLGPQAECDAAYDTVVAKPQSTAVTSSGVTTAAPTAAAPSTTTEADSSDPARKRAKLMQQTPVADAAAMEVDAPDAAESSIAPATSSAVPLPAGSSKRRTKHAPPPPTQPPFELLPLPAAFAAQHLPFFVWRTWHADWQQARAATPTLSLSSFLASPAAPALCNALLPVVVRCPSGGLPEDGALLCAPLGDEWRRLHTQMPAPAPEVVTSKQRQQGGSKAHSWDVLQEHNNKLPAPHVHPLRATIGHVVHGWFSYQLGMGVGMAFVAAEQFVPLLQQQASATPAVDEPAVHVWCRNQSGLAYRAAQLHLFPQ